MAIIDFNYSSFRAQKARLGVLLGGSRKLLPILYWVMLVSGLVMITFGESFGYLISGLAIIPYMLKHWYEGELRHIPNAKGQAADDNLSADILGRLPKNPSPRDIARAVAQVSGGIFMGMRFGITPSLLDQITSENPDDTPAVWQAAEAIRSLTGTDRYTGSILATALVRQFPNYEQLIGQIYLSDDDLIAGVRWQKHLRELFNNQKNPIRTGGIARDWSFGYIPMLERFGYNVSTSAVNALAAVDLASHESTINQLVDIFGTRGRQNAALVGQTGSGRTTAIHSFARKLLDAESKLPDSLKFRQVFILDATSLIAAAPGRGELEELIMRVLGEAYTAKNIIICLDNAQLFFEEGVGSVDLTNTLQPILEAGNLRIILSIDEQQFLKIGQRNPGIVNALNRINVAPANQEETMRVMQEQLIISEHRRHVTYTYQALKECYRLSERYMHDIAQPGKAMKLLEAAASYHQNGLVTMNSVQQAIEQTLDVKVSVATDIADRDRLLDMENLIHRRMINQRRAVKVVSDALRRARAGVRNENRPIGTFLFLGPTGVGKTELAKALAEVYFGGEKKIIRLDLNEFVRPDDVMRLIADGADDANSLTAQVMKQPFSVVLLDEIEKAAPEVQTTLLQLLDEGVLRDVKNREVSFRDAIVIATSNAGADRIREYIERGYDITQFEAQFVDELINSNQFRPEFLNRFDEICVFTPLSKEDLLKVADIILAGVNKTLEPQKIKVAVDDPGKQLLVEAGYDPRLGARPMRRMIQRAVENNVAKRLLEGSIEPGSTALITVEQIGDALDSNS